jgi:hypothetical protein
MPPKPETTDLMTRNTSLLMDAAGHYAYVHDGFSWPAFFLGPLWAVAKRRWWFLLPMLGVEACLWFGSQLAVNLRIFPLMLLVLLAELAYFLLRGWYGNRWLAASLQRNGYARVD